MERKGISKPSERPFAKFVPIISAPARPGPVVAAIKSISEGEIVAVGPGAVNNDGKRNPIDVKVGDKVLFSKYSGDEVKIDGQDLIIIKEEDIIGILN